MPTTHADPAQSLPESLHERYALVKDRVAAAATRAGRKPDDIILVAVTKFADPEDIRELMQLGHRDFGENKVQQLIQRAAMAEEYLQRLRVLQNSRQARRADASDSLFPSKSLLDAAEPTPVRWHMIGHLQRNKAKKAAELVRLIHSVDSLRLAEELQAIGLKRDHVIEVLIEVNCSAEASKQGCPVPAAIPLAEQIETMAHVRVRGLMTMAPIHGQGPHPRIVFERCRELFEEMRKLRLSEGKFNILSMGMSGDFEDAIAEGANIVRVGTSIFGPGREQPDTDDTDD